jgi:hypothetical protein
MLRHVGPTCGAAKCQTTHTWCPCSGSYELQDVQELSNFFERRVSAYQVGVTGTVAFDQDL